MHKCQATLLLKAAKYGHCDVITILVEHGCDINTCARWTPLIVAADNNRADVLQHLLQAKADPEIDIRSGRALTRALRSHNHEAAQVLIESNVDIHSADQFEWNYNPIPKPTPFEQAFIHNNLHGVRLLIKAKVNVTLTQDLERKLIYGAVHPVGPNYIEKVRMLLSVAAGSSETVSQ